MDDAIHKLYHAKIDKLEFQVKNLEESWKFISEANKLLREENSTLRESNKLHLGVINTLRGNDE